MILVSICHRNYLTFIILTIYTCRMSGHGHFGEFGPIFAPADMGLFNWQCFLNNGKYFKILICILKEAVTDMLAKNHSIP